MTVYLVKRFLIINSGDFWKLIWRLFKSLLVLFRGDHYDGIVQSLYCHFSTGSLLELYGRKTSLWLSRRGWYKADPTQPGFCTKRSYTELYIQSYKIISSQVYM